MEPKKISFGFSKTKKLSLIANNKSAFKEESKVELIKCLEGQEIKLVEEKPVEAPLVIPLHESQKTSAAIASLIKRRAVLLGEDDASAAQETQGEADTKADAVPNGGVANLEQRAALELLADLKGDANDAGSSSLVLPIVKPDELPLDGAKESTLDDYDSIPIQQFGMAMLRGMGFVEPPKKKAVPGEEDAPFVRPKGMGLGADKALKAKPLLVQPEANEVLEIKKQAYVRILGGKHKDSYGQIEGFDDHAARVIVKMAIGGNKEAFNEFLCQPVSRKEYAQYGKCINTARYEEYKKLENEHGQIIVKKEEQEEKPRVKKEVVEPRKRFEENDCDRKESKVKGEKYKDSNGSNARDRAHSRETERSEPRTKEPTSRRNDCEDERRGSSRRLEEEHDRHGSSSKPEDRCSREKRSSRSRERRDYKAQSTSSNRRRQLPAEPEQSQSTDETSDSDSSDSAYERKHKKKSKSRNKSKSKSQKKSKTSKKSSRKHSKARHKHYSSSSSDTSDTDTAASSEDERHKRKHKKKTKKSKKPRSRTRSRSRGRK